MKRIISRVFIVIIVVAVAAWVERDVITDFARRQFTSGSLEHPISLADEDARQGTGKAYFHDDIFTVELYNGSKLNVVSVDVLIAVPGKNVTRVFRPTATELIKELRNVGVTQGIVVPREFVTGTKPAAIRPLSSGTLWVKVGQFYEDEDLKSNEWHWTITAARGFR